MAGLGAFLASVALAPQPERVPERPSVSTPLVFGVHAHMQAPAGSAGWRRELALERAPLQAPGPPPPGPPTPPPAEPRHDAALGCAQDIPACLGRALTWVVSQVTLAILRPVLDGLSVALLSTPSPDSVPGLERLWAGSWQLLLAGYGLLVLVAGVLLMGYETVQTRTSIRELAPRLVLGFVAGGMSFAIAVAAIGLANAMSRALLGGSAESLVPGIDAVILRAVTDGGGAGLLLGLVVAGMVLVLLVTCVVRISLTIILVAGAPIALMWHALPQTEGVARWWWRAFAGCLGTQIAQSLVVIVVLTVLVGPSGSTTWAGSAPPALVTLLVIATLLYLLIKIPFWMLSAAKPSGGGRSLVGSLVRGMVTYRVYSALGARGGSRGGFGSLLSGRGYGPHSPSGRPGPGGPRAPGGGPGGPRGGPTGGPRGGRGAPGRGMVIDGDRVARARGARRAGPGPSANGSAPRDDAGASGANRDAGEGGAVDPYRRVRSGADGQLRLPLGVRRRPTGRSPGRPRNDTGSGQSPGTGRESVGRQLWLPLGQQWPEDRPRRGRAGQYRLPVEAPRVPSASAAAEQARAHLTRPWTTTPSGPSAGAGAGAGPRPGRSRQMELPFDPYTGNRARRDGQYPLPQELPARDRDSTSARRARAHLERPWPAGPESASDAPAPPPVNDRRQLRLPLRPPATRTPPEAPTRRGRSSQGGER